MNELQKEIDSCTTPDVEVLEERMYELCDEYNKLMDGWEMIKWKKILE